MHLSRGWRILIVAGAVLGVMTVGVCNSRSSVEAGSLAQSDNRLTLSKSGDPATFTQAGDQIQYTYTVTVDLNGYSVDFPFYNLSIQDDKTKVECPQTRASSLQHTFICTSTYTVTEADMAAGQVVNSATASGEYVEEPKGCCSCSGDHIPLQANASFTATLAEPALELEKSGSPATFTGPDQEISYEYTVQNTGGGVLPGPVQVSDDLVQVSCPAGNLEPGESLTCSATYRTTAGDVAAGTITNHATATAGEASDSDSFTVTLEAAPALELTKGSDPTTFSKTGTLIRFTFNVTNTGNVPIEGPFEIQDPMLDQQECPDGPLEPGATLTCQGYYSTAFRDLNKTITNCARARGYYLGGPVRSPEACTSLYYQPARDREGSSACDIDPESVDCICSKNPEDPVCYE